MKFVQHPQHTRNLGAPIGWDHSKIHCGSLSIQDRVQSGQPLMESAWSFEGRESLLLALGLAQVRLAVFGTMHPPVSMQVVQTVVDRQAVVKAVEKALTDLAEYASELRLVATVTTGPNGVAVRVTDRPENTGV